MKHIILFLLLFFCIGVNAQQKWILDNKCGAVSIPENVQCVIDVVTNRNSTNITPISIITQTKQILSDGQVFEFCEGFDTVTVATANNEPGMIESLTVTGKSIVIESAPEHYARHGFTFFNEDFPDIILSATGFYEAAISPDLTIVNPSSSRSMLGFLDLSVNWNLLERQGFSGFCRFYMTVNGVETLVMTRRRWYQGAAFRWDATTYALMTPNVTIPPGGTLTASFRVEMQVVSVSANPDSRIDSISGQLTGIFNTTN